MCMAALAGQISTNNPDLTVVVIRGWQSWGWEGVIHWRVQGVARDAPFEDPNSFIFMQFSAKKIAK